MNDDTGQVLKQAFVDAPPVTPEADELFVAEVGRRARVDRTLRRLGFGVIAAVIGLAGLALTLAFGALLGPPLAGAGAPYLTLGLCIALLALAAPLIIRLRA